MDWFYDPNATLYPIDIFNHMPQLFGSFLCMSLVVALLTGYVLIKDRKGKPNLQSVIILGINAILLYGMFLNLWVFVFTTQLIIDSKVESYAGPWTFISLALGIVWVCSIGISAYRFVMRRKDPNVKVIEIETTSDITV